MNAKNRKAVGARMLRGVLALSGAAVLWCAMALPSLAQVEPPKAQAQNAPPARSMAAVNENVSSTGQKPAVPVAEEKKGQHEGITVHGHWIIDVKNPDGKVAKHVEFENSIASGGIFPGNAGSISVPGGNAFLSALLTGQVVSPVGSWLIFLEGAGGTILSSGSPCAVTNELQSCLLMQNGPNNPLASACSGFPGISCDLSITPLGTSPNFMGFQLSGSVAATQGGAVSTVATAVTGACGPSNASLANCALGSSQGDAFFTSRSDFPGAPLAVAAGQSIAVTVQISFQ